MMQQLQMGDQILLFDRSRTEAAYSAMKTGDAERCGCTSCKNFAAQRSVAYPASFRAILKQLGIDEDKEGEAYEYGADALLWRYDGWFYLSGELVEPGERMTNAGFGFQFYFTDASHLPKPAVDFGDHVLAIEFTGVKIPWVIAERPST
jgi:hypothetical protein